MFVSLTFIATLIRFITTLLVYEIKNNGDKFYDRKSMWVADEKLIINELGPDGHPPTITLEKDPDEKLIIIQ